jgi:hypothetical protein
VKPLEAPASLRPWFWAGVLAVLAYEVAVPRSESGPVLLAGNVVAGLSLLPAGLWCARRVYGLPLFPLFALTHLPTFAFPLISPTAEVARYSVEARLAGAGAVIAFLVIATALWYSFASRPVVPREFRTLRRGDYNRLFLAFVWLGALFQFLNNAGWLPDLPPGTYPVLRNGSQGLAAIGSSVLAYRWGSRRLGAGTVAAFVVGFGLLLLLSAASLMIVLAVSNFAVVAAMYTLGRGRIPVWVLVAAFVGFSVLHAGKHEMRKEYWTGTATLRPADYPAYYAEWVGRGLANLARGETGSGPSANSSLSDRASLLQMLLLVMDKSPSEKPFLDGQTYALVPELLVPRLLMSDKVVSHEGTYMLAIYYGRQTREDTRSTTIGFGLLAEAYANFGWPGVLGLGVFVGLGLGAVTRWSAAAPIDSFRGLFALYVLGLSIATEHTLGVTAASLSQGTIILLVVSAVLMETRRPADRP